MKKSFSSFAVFIFVLIFSLIFAQEWFFSLSSLKELELKLIDKRFSERGQINLKDRSLVTICTIDQESFNQLPVGIRKYPLNRKIFAKAIENLNKLGAKVIGIDVLFSTFDQFSKKNDEELISAIKKFGNVVLAGKINEHLESNNFYSFFNSKLNYNFENVYYDSDSSVGIVRVVPDLDNVYRRYLPAVKVTSINKTVPSFGLAILNKYLSLTKNIVAKNEDGYFYLDNIKIPKYDEYSFLINFYGPNNTFPTVKLIDVIDDKDFQTQDEIDYKTQLNNYELIKNDTAIVNKIKDKIILIGSTMPEDRDLLATSFSLSEVKGSNIMYGVEFHANAINNVLNYDFINKIKKQYEILLLILLSAISFWSTYFIRKVKTKMNSLLEIINVVIIAIIIIAVYKYGIYLFINKKILIEIVPFIVITLISYFGSTTYYVLKERKQAQYIKSIFSQYVNKQVVQELISNSDKIKLGGERKNITTMFCDMVGFTTFSENKEPETLVNFINSLLNELTNIIFANNGTLDKYIGDAIMAFWGAPIENNQHAYLACKAAVEMQEKVKSISREWEAKGEQKLQIRIGINTGDAIVGNVGGEKHKNYTVMGDEVNLASRLEGANKEYFTHIMISDSTYELIRNDFFVRELDLIRVKGKQKPTYVYELIGFNNNKKSEEKFDSLKIYFEALKNYKEKKFKFAKELFEKSFNETQDMTSKMYANRCKILIENPPDKNWDGVFNLVSK